MSRYSRHEPVMFQRSRLLALPLVLLCAVVYLGSAAHFVLVQHSTCPVHGELVHGDLHGHEQLQGQPAVSFSDARIAALQEASTGHRSDVHCSHSFLRRGAPLPLGRELTAPDAPAPEELPRVDRLGGEPQVAWLRLAPKASPPRA